MDSFNSIQTIIPGINKILNTVKKFGMLFQGSALFDSLNVWQNISFGLIKGNRINSKIAKEIVVSGSILILSANLIITRIFFGA